MLLWSWLPTAFKCGNYSTFTTFHLIIFSHFSKCLKLNNIISLKCSWICRTQKRDWKIFWTFHNNPHKKFYIHFDLSIPNKTIYSPPFYYRDITDCCCNIFLVLQRFLLQFPASCYGTFHISKLTIRLLVSKTFLTTKLTTFFFF